MLAEDEMGQTSTWNLGERCEHDGAVLGMFEDEECSFTPKIKYLPGVESTMNDYMESWSKQKRWNLVEATLERYRAEIEEVYPHPPVHNRATNEAILKETGYASPVKDWLAHAKRYHQSREPVEEAHPRQETAPRTSWREVVQRLFPDPHPAVASCVAEKATQSSPGRSQAKDADTSMPGEDECRPGTGNQRSPRSSIAKPGVCPDPGETESGTCTNQSQVPGMPGRRRYGRPPKATWEYLFEAGTRRLRGQSLPAPAPQCQTPRPIPHSEELLKSSQRARQPLWSPVPITSHSGATSSGKDVGTPRQAAHRSHSGEGRKTAQGAGRNLYERCEREQALRQERIAMITERRQEDEMRECTFLPRTNSSTKASHLSARDRGLSLYERGMQAQQRRSALEEEGVQRQKEHEMKECKFRPQITESVPQLRAPEAQARKVGKKRSSTPNPSHSAGWLLSMALEEEKEEQGRSSPGIEAAVLAAPAAPAVPVPPVAPAPPATPVAQKVANVSTEVFSMLEDWKRNKQAPGGWLSSRSNSTVSTCTGLCDKLPVTQAEASGGWLSSRSCSAVSTCTGPCNRLPATHSEAPRKADIPDFVVAMSAPSTSRRTSQDKPLETRGDATSSSGPQRPASTMEVQGLLNNWRGTSQNTRELLARPCHQPSTEVPPGLMPPPEGGLIQDVEERIADALFQLESWKAGQHANPIA